MNVIRTAIPDVLLFEPKVFGDARGFFFESLNARAFRERTGTRRAFRAGQPLAVGARRSARAALPDQAAAGKARARVAGEVFDVAVDLRRSSPTFGKWVGERLSAENKRMMWIPEVSHTVLVLTDSADFLYKTTDYYAPEHERTIAWNDPELAISWPLARRARPLGERPRRRAIS